MVVVDQTLRKSKKMSREQSDGEIGTAGTEGEVEFRLPRGTGPGLDGIPKDVPIVTGAAGAEAGTCDLGQTRRLGPLSGVKTISVLAGNAVYTVPGACQSASEGRSAASN